MVLKGERCLIRPWRPADAESLTRHANNIEVAKHLRDRFPHPYLPAHAASFIRAAMHAPPPTNFAIEVAGEAAGGIGFVRGSDIERYSAEIGYWLGGAYWGRGIATEAVILVTEYAFGEEHLLRLYAVPFADNRASIRVLEKAGYRLEGILRASSVKYGEPRDQALYAKVNDAWRSR